MVTVVAIRHSCHHFCVARGRDVRNGVNFWGAQLSQLGTGQSALPPPPYSSCLEMQKPKQGRAATLAPARTRKVSSNAVCTTHGKRESDLRVTEEEARQQKMQGLRTVRALLHANGTPTHAMQHENEDARVTQRDQPHRWFEGKRARQTFLCLSSRLRGGRTTIRLEKKLECFKRPTPFGSCGGGGGGSRRGTGTRGEPFFRPSYTSSKPCYTVDSEIREHDIS